MKQPRPLPGGRTLEMLAAYLMLGFFLGFTFFYSVFHYYAAPFNAAMPGWLLLMLLVLVGMMAGYLFPEQKDAMASSVILPLLGALFCFVIFISPTWSPDIAVGNLSDEILILAKFLLPDMILAVIVLFVSTFMMVILREEFPEDGQEA